MVDSLARIQTALLFANFNLIFFVNNLFALQHDLYPDTTKLTLQNQVAFP